VTIVATMLLAGLVMKDAGFQRRDVSARARRRVDHRLDHRHVLRTANEGGKIMNALYKA
jgi:hypothetical protein